MGKASYFIAGLLISISASAQVGQPTLESYNSRAVVITVPAGNRNELMPNPGEGTKKFLAKEDADEWRAINKKYAKTLKTLQNKDGAILRMVNRIAPLYGVKPIHVLGAIVGEHTFNVSIIDDAQSYVAFMYSKWVSNFEGDKLPVVELLEQPELRQCDGRQSNYEYWNCVGYVWQNEFRGRNKNRKTWQDASLIMAFFNPMGAGKTYGLGQMSPLRVLMANDVVRQKAGLPELNAYQAGAVYKAVLDPETTIHYIAANMAMSIHYYQVVANFDISDNPGVTATLYNLGNEKGRAHTLFQQNVKLLKSGREIQLPSENHYGWWVNEKRAELESLLEKYSR